jgi:hypothetical protein
MTTPTAGSAISLLDIQNEFGGSTPISINEYYSQGASVNTIGIAGIPASGTIAFSDFYNKNAKAEVSLPANTTLYNVNVYSYLSDRGWNGVAPVTFIIPSTTYIGSNDIQKASLTISGRFPNGLTVINNGYIIGRGGQGGIGRDGPINTPYYNATTRTNGSTAAGRNGENGGTGLTIADTAVNVSITNNGVIAGGGGGGGGGAGGDWNGYSYDGSDAGGSGGGGGAGLPGGNGGTIGYPYGYSEIYGREGMSNGYNGSTFDGGAGGASGDGGGYGPGRWGGAGGVGGALGQAGAGGYNGGFANAGGGGAPGQPIIGINNATWLNSGTTYGTSKIDTGVYSVKLGGTKLAVASGANVVTNGLGSSTKNNTSAEERVDDGYWGPAVSVPWDWKLFGASIKTDGTTGGMFISSNSYIGIASSVTDDDMKKYSNFTTSSPPYSKIMMNAGDRETRGKYVYINLGPNNWYYKVYYKGWTYNNMLLDGSTTPVTDKGPPYDEWEITFISPTLTEAGKMMMEIRVNNVTTAGDNHLYYMANADGTQYFDLAPHLVPGKTTLLVGDSNGYNWKAYNGAFYYPGLGDLG